MQEASPATYPTPSLAADRLRLAERLSARTLLLGGVMTVILALFIGVEQDPDFWWHLKIGQWMVQHGQLPSTDIFTFTATGHSWTDHEYLTGFAWLGVAIASELLSWAWNLDNPAHKMHARRLAVIAAVSAVAVVATPHLFSLYPYPFQTQGSEAQQRLIVEWASPNFHNVELRPFEAMIFLIVIGFALRRPKLYDVLLALAGLGLALQSVRNIALFIAVATPILINTYGEWWKELAAAQKWKFNLPPRPAFAAVTAIALVLIIGVTALRVSNTISPQRQQQLDAANYPVGAADWLAAHPDVGTRMFNQYGFGGYLAYRFYPQPNRKVFIFGEAALMGDGLLNEYADVYYVRSDWKKVLDKYKIDYVVENRGDPLANLLATQSDWTLVYQDKVAVIYIKNKPQPIL